MIDTTALHAKLAQNNTHWAILRIAVALMIGIHGWYRLLHGGVTPFGLWLNAQGIPLGAVVAWAITLAEMIGAPLLAARVVALPLTITFSAIYLCGIAMIHAKAGWFVVGAGRNGMEFSVLLIACLVVLGLREAYRKDGKP
jgi:putative oxidoreductase